MAESTSTLQEKLKALTHGKVDIMLDADTFKSTTQILREMSAVWEEMTDIEQAAALELMGGKRQSNILSSLISNFETVEEVIETSMNSSGSAMAENAKWMDSIEGKSITLSNNMQALWENTLNSDVIKWFYDIGIGATELIKDIGLLPPALAAVLVYFKAFKNIDPISLGKDFLTNVKSYNAVVQQVKQMSSLGLNNLTMSGTGGLLDSQAVNAYANAVSGMSAKQQAAILTTNGLQKAQAAQVLAQNRVAEATIRETLGQEALNASKVKSTVLTGNEIKAKLLEQGVSKKSVVVKWLAAHATEQLTRDKILAAIASGKFKGATDQEIASLLGLVGATNAASAGFKGLSASIRALFMSNPAGWILTIISLLPMAISLVKSFKKSNDELIQQASEIKNAYKEESDAIEGNISTIQGLEDEFTKLSRGVDDYGNNISLATDDYERYKEIVETIVGISPELISGYDKEGNALANKNSLIEQSIKLMQEEQRIKAKEYLSDKNIKTITNGATANFDDYVEIPSNIAVSGVKINDDGTTQSGFNNQISGYIEEAIGVGFNNQGIDKYIQENLNLVEQNVGRILDIASKDFTDSNGNKWQSLSSEQLESLETYLYSVINITNTASDDIRSILQLVPQTKTGYYDLQGSTQKFLTQYADSFNITKDSTAEDVNAMIDEVSKFTDFVLNNPELESIIQTGFNLNSGKDADGNVLNVAEYQKQIEEFKKNIQESAYTDNQKNTLLSMLGFDDNLSNNIDKAITHATNLLKNEFDDQIGSLSASDILITTKITEDPNSLTFDELKDKIQGIKDSLGTDVVSVKTYSSMVESMDAINEVLTQTSEIVTDNTEVTQEYKDALTKLGISSKDLSECFYESNPLVVKNVSALNKLVKSAKTTAAQNAKLAKSQARLEYYEKYKELQKLTNGQKVTTAATLNQVKAIYAEMTALQKSISRYSMLEHQLLGAANAYEEFANAQDIDAANDYESKAEEMVGYLVDAFQTAKLGTESAQAAIRGLVPESVYEDLDTLDDKMDAVYEYFTQDLSKYFYVKFNDDGSLESAEMLVDNVKQFVEDGISNNVFTGSWEEWDLDPTINSLDELAEKMGVTKEVAYAFLQAMETYDISWIGGDASTLLDKLVPSSAEIEAFTNQIQEQLKNTSIDIDVQPQVNTEKLKEQGYTVDDGQTFEVLSYQDADGSYVNLTPVLPDGSVVSKDSFDKYIQDQLNAGGSLKDLTIDGYKVYVDTYDTQDAAEKAAKQLESDIKDYQSMVKSYSLESAIYANTQKQAELEYKIGTGQITADTVVGADGTTTAGEQLKQLNKDAEENARAARENADAWTNANKSYEDAKKVVADLNVELEKAHKASDDSKVAEIQGKLEKAEGTLWDTYAALVKCGEPTEVTLTVAMEQVQKDLENLKKDMTEDELDIAYKVDISNLEKDKDGKWIVDVDAYSNLDEASKAKVQQYIDYLAEEHNINILQGEGAITTLDVLTEIKELLSKTYDLMVQTDEAQTKAQSFADVWNSIRDKTVTLTQNIKEGVVSFFTRTPKDDDAAGVNGTAHVGGTAFASGSWGASSTETSLVGELGPELLVRGNRWTTVGENGAEFTEVRKGDVIFNHKQTESLLKNGYVTSRGKAYASGTAFAPGSVHPYLSGMGNIDDDWQNITPTLWDAATNGEYLADAMEDAADSVAEFEETIDWIEIRMEELDERLNLYNAQLENAATYNDKNNIIDDMIQVNHDIYANAMAGAEYYQTYANKYLAGMSDELVEAAKNGAIAITEFTKEQDEATVEAIQNYRDFTQKAADLTQKATETIAQVRDLAIQKIDNIQEYGSAKTDIEDAQTEKLQNRVDLDETRGLITSPAYYTAMMENSGKKIEYWTPLLKDMQEQFDNAVEKGEIQVGTVDWYDGLKKLYDVQAEIDTATIELEEFQNAINDIYWDNFDQLINRIDYVKEDIQSLIDLMDSADMVITPETDDGWGADQVEWTKEGMATLGLYAQQMETAEYEARQYAKAIDDLSADYKNGLYSEDEYLEKLNELKKGQYENIEAYYDAQDAIVELNKARVDAIKEGIEKEIDAYEELISKKKEELSVEKDLYDFQKGVADQQKNIADIQRKLAALSTDNSASAVAKRRQLEAELAEANAELEETYYDRSVENQQNALDKELEDFKEEKDAEIEKWEEYLTNVEQVVTDSLNIVQANATEIGNTLTGKAQEYNLTVSDAVLTPWKDGALAVSEYQTAFDTATSSTTTKLEEMKNKWQEVIDKMAEAGQIDVNNINAENANYAAAEKAPEPKPENKPENNNANKEKTIVVGGKIKATGAKIYSKIGGTGYVQYFASDPIYTVLSEQEGWLKVRHHKASRGETGWFKKSDVKAYAKGTLGVEKDQWALIDELGEELVMHADGSGKLSFMTKGTTVIPHDITENIMGLGQLDPTDILNRNRPQIAPSKSVINNNMEIHVDASVGELIHVERIDGNNLDEITKVVDKAWNKKMQGLNSAIKKFSR